MMRKTWAVTDDLVELQLELRKMVVDDPTLAPVGLALSTGDPEDTRGFLAQSAHA